MPKYYTAVIPLSEIDHIQIYINARRETLRDIKKETGADYIMNGGFYNPDWSPCAILKADGKMQSAAPWKKEGFGWNSGSDIQLLLDYNDVSNFITGHTLLINGIKQSVNGIPQSVAGARQRTAMAIEHQNLILYCTSVSTTPKMLQREFSAMGCSEAIMLDGGGSSQCDFRGEIIRSDRIVQNYILVYTKKKIKEDDMGKKTICIDPGHGIPCANGTPDHTYLEREFAWDEYTRLRPALERQGFEVIVTKHSAGELPALSERAAISNAAHADLFISLHSNAAGNNGWYDARGFKVYTSSPGKMAKRNIAAQAVVDRAREAGIIIRGSGIGHALFTVLAKTKAPAMLIEYGFHTSREDAELLKDAAYKDKLAEVTAQGVCDFFNVEYVPPEDTEPDETITDFDRVQERYGFADETMAFLASYQYADELLKKLATE